MERAERLYDCITQVSDQYIQEAETFEIPQGNMLSFNWKRWSSMAAALVVVVGVGLAVSQLGGGASDTSAPAMSEPACSAPAASAPAAEDVEPPEAVEQPGLSGGQGFDYMTADGAVYSSLEQLVSAADVIAEGCVVDVHENVEIDISLQPDQEHKYSYTVVDVEVLTAVKGNVEAGEVIPIKLMGVAAEAIDVGDEWICFLEDYRNEKPEMPFSPLNLKQGIAVVYGDSVAVEESFLPEFHNDGSGVDRAELLDRIKCYVED